MANFTFTRDLLERQPGPKRHYKDWKAGETYVMTREHATALEEQGYGYTHEREHGTGASEEREGVSRIVAQGREDSSDRD